jgi:hypothetical protein
VPVIHLDGVSWTILLGWPWTVILLVSASQVVKITGMSHWVPLELFGPDKYSVRICSADKKRFGSLTEWEGHLIL